MINLQFSWTTITIISFILFFIVIGLTIGIIMFLNKNKGEEISVIEKKEIFEAIKSIEDKIMKLKISIDKKN